MRKHPKFFEYVIWNEKSNKWENTLPKEAYTRFTQDEEENEKYEVIKELNNVLGKISKWKHVYPLNIIQGTSNFVDYDRDRERYMLSNKR